MRTISFRGRWLFAAMLACGLASAGAWSYRQTQPLLAARRTHEAFTGRNPALVVAESESIVAAPDRQGEILTAMTERCLALTYLERAKDCLALLDARLLAGDAHQWLPVEVLPIWFDHAVGQGRRNDAAAVARRWQSIDPTNPFAANWVFYLRLGDDDAAAALQDALRWANALPPDDALRLRLRVASEMIGRHEGANASAALGTVPPTTSDPILATNWWALRITAAADAGDQRLAASVRDDWIAAGGSGPTARAYYAIAISRASVIDPAFEGWIPPLLASFDEGEQLTDPALRRSVITRLLGHLAIEEERELLAIYLDRAKAIDPTVVSNEAELRRLIVGTGAPSGDRPPVRFTVDQPVVNASLWVSADATERPDGKWEQVLLDAAGTGTTQRSSTQTPYRWVYRSETETFGSGTFWPSGGDTELVVQVNVLAKSQVRLPPADLQPRPERDGNRRVWVVLLDCGDWRITSYLRQRGELPSLQALFAQGWRAGLLQDPPFTAAAMEALTQPALRRSASFPNSLNQIGLELAGLSSVGSNPFSALKFVLPEVGDLFASVGAGDTRVGNMLFAHGNVKAGRNAVITGPNGRISSLDVGALRRDRSIAETAMLPQFTLGLDLLPAIEESLSGAAAQLDAVVQEMGANNIDVLLYRLETLDLLTHGHYAAIAAAGQDNGVGQLFSIYRYIDFRLAEVARAIDSDDVLIVMSDHGIKTSMEHHPVTMFVAWGNGVPQGRTRGYPELRGVARVIAEMRGVATNWPETGVVPWVQPWRAGTTAPGLGVPYPLEEQP